MGAGKVCAATEGAAGLGQKAWGRRPGLVGAALAGRARGGGAGRPERFLSLRLRGLQVVRIQGLDQTAMVISDSQGGQGLPPLRFL